MMGWRCGYIAFPTPEAGAPADLGAQLTKVQDTIPICASQVTLPCASTFVSKKGHGACKERVLMPRIAQPH
jgi:aspartate/methionine/tyrosine aminotransferase